MNSREKKEEKTKEKLFTVSLFASDLSHRWRKQLITLCHVVIVFLKIFCRDAKTEEIEGVQPIQNASLEKTTQASPST